MNTLFCQLASADGDGEDAEERAQRCRSPITRASVHFMAVNGFERECLFSSYAAMKKERLDWVSGVMEGRINPVHIITRSASKQICVSRPERKRRDREDEEESP